jgi:basic membrane protein A
MLGAALAAAVALSAGAAAAKTADGKTLFVYVTPNSIGVNAFLKMGQTGIEAVAAKYGAESKIYESNTPDERLNNVNAAINDGADLIMVLGFEFNDIIADIAPTAPDVQFLIVDQCLDELPANVACAVFREYEASYLIGVEAAMLAKGNSIGVVGALDIPFLHRYTEGYRLGAQLIRPNIAVDVRWVGGENPFADPVRAKEQALALQAAGDEPIYTATAGGDHGVFEAAQEGDFRIFSVDVNWCPSVPGHLIDVSLKKVDNAIMEAVDRIEGGETSFMMALGLKEQGVGVVALDDAGIADSGCLIAGEPDVVAKVKEVAAQIIDGTITIDDPMFAQ